MRPVRRPVIIPFLAVEQEIAQTIENRLPLVHFTPLRAMRVGSHHGIRTPIDEITVTGPDLRHRDIDIFDTIVGKDEKVINLLPGIRDSMAELIIVYIRTTQPVPTGYIVKNSSICGEGSSQETEFQSPGLDNLRSVCFFISPCTESAISESGFHFQETRFSPVERMVIGQGEHIESQSLQESRRILVLEKPLASLGRLDTLRLERHLEIDDADLARPDQSLQFFRDFDHGSRRFGAKISGKE